jgi:hypothetical protein
MEAQERQTVVDQLDSSRDDLGSLVAGLTAGQWRFSPGEGRWSIGQCVEHVTRVERRVFGLIGKKLEENNPEPAKATPEQKAKDGEVARLIPDRTIRRNAPEPAQPVGEWSDGSELVADFEKTRQGTTEFARTTQGALRNYFIPHALFGELDCYQWLLALSLHGVRHARQIEEIKAAPGYPES